MKKIVAWLTTTVLIISILGMANVGSLNHAGGGASAYDMTYSGINLTGYHWVVYEVDDWGGRGTLNLTEHDDLGKEDTPYWMNTTLVSVDDLDDYFAVLADHPDVVANAFFFTEMNGTEGLQIPLNRTNWIEETPYNSSGPNYRGDVTSKWKEGYNNGYWLPQYHTRTHNQEYVYNQSNTILLGECNKTVEECQVNISTGLAQFYNLFDFHSESTVAGGHYLSDNTLAAFKNTSVYGHSNAPGYGWNATGVLKDWAWYQFEVRDTISCVGRTTSINEKNMSHLSTLMDSINTSFDNAQIVVIEDHRVGYASGIRDVTAPGDRNESLQLLDEIFTGIETWYPDVWYLTSPEMHQLNLRGYSIQNWTSSIVVRNALNNTTSITVDLPPGWDANIVTVTNDTNVSKEFTKGDSRTITLDVPHNETFTVYRNFGANPPSYSEYDFSGIQSLIMAAAVIVIIVILVFKGMVGPMSKSFGKMK